MLKINIFFLLIIFSIIGFSQAKENVIITGKIIDKDTKNPLEYATISFFNKKENKIIEGGITNEKGLFSINVPRGIYNISIEYISYKTITLPNKKLITNNNLGNIALEIDFESLGEVEIIAEKTTVEIKLDKKIFNVGKDLTVSGGTVSDVLDNIPSVSVDIEGNVALRGNENVKILINGKPSGLVGLNSTEALQQLPAESIEKVEVITAPSARYESEGTAGILNIILRRSKLQGLNGAITLNAGTPESAGVSGNINYRTGDINFFNTTSYNSRKTIGHSYTNTRFKDEGNYVDEKRDWTDIRKGITTNTGIEWYITNSASLTTSIVYKDYDSDSDSKNRILQFNENLDFIGENNRLDPNFEKNKTIQYATNYTKNFKTNGHKLTFDFQYEDSNAEEKSLIFTNSIETDKINTLEDQQNILLQSDYVLPLGENNQFEIGYRGNFNTKITDYAVELLNEDNVFSIDKKLSNLFNFKVYINAVYTQYGSKIDKFSYLLGVRMENTQTTIDQPTSGDFKKKNITGLFPTVNLSYSLNEKESLTLGYNKRIQRPRSFHLNPFPSRISLTNIFQGNPDLNPSYSHLYDLGYLNRFKKFTLSTSIYYQNEKNDSNWVSIKTGETVTINNEEIAVVQRTPVNISNSHNYGFEFNLSYNPSRKWRINTDFNIFQSTSKGEFNGTDFSSDNLRWTIKLSNKYTLPGNIDWQTNINYNGPSEDSQNKREAIFVTNMAFSKDLFKEKASIAFNINDLFNSRSLIGEIETEDFYTERDIQFRGGQTFNLSFTYRFNQKKKRERNNFNNGGSVDM